MVFDLQPTLQDSLVTLVPLQEGDFEELYEVASDPLIWEQHPNSDRYKRDVFEVFFQKAIESKGALRILDSTTGHTIGSTRFYDFDDSTNSIVIGYTFLKRSHWGGAYNKSVKKLMLLHAFKSVSQVFFKIGVNNIRSRKAIQGIGATELHLEADGNVCYVIQKNYWSKVNSFK